MKETDSRSAKIDKESANAAARQADAEHKGHDIAVITENAGAQPPETFTGLRLGKARKKAAGFPALAAALTQAGRYMAPADAVRTMFRLNQKGGFDCPGCAWPDPDDERSALGEYCENGVKAIAEEAQKKTIGRSFFARHSVSEMLRWSDFEIGKKGRLAEPMVLREGATHYAPISWEAAFRLIAEELNGLASPDEAVFYTSGRTSNEAAFLYQLFVREYGTNNLPDCSNMCHESSGMGLSQTVGIGKGSVTLTDFYEAEVVMVIGQNPGTNHPRMLSALERCKENGGRIITVNPLPEAGLLNFVNPQRPLKMLSGGTPLTDLFLQVKVNGDIALLKAIMLRLLEEERKAPGTVFDLEFIREKTEGYESFIHELEKHGLERLVEESGVERRLIEAAVAMIRDKKKIIICWAMGLTQQENGVDNIKEVVNLLLLKGSIGKPGAGTCPVRGHSNVQGDRTMGIWEAPKPAFLDKLKSTFGFEPPRRHGYAVVDAIKAMYQGEAKVFFAMGGNFLSATPDTEYTARALKNCRLTVHVSTKLNRSHLIHGRQALILPCLGRTDRDVQAGGEQLVSIENSMGVVQSSRGVLPPPSSHLLSEPAIVAGLARATLGPRSTVHWDAMAADYDNIRDAIEKVIPGFEDYNRRVREPGGFYLPNGAREQRFDTPGGKAVFTVTKVPDNEIDPGQFVMMTIRSHDQFNTTIYGLDDRYRGIYNERRVVMMNPEDMAADGYRLGQVVDLIGEYRGQAREAKRFIVTPFSIPRRCVATYFPEANVLVPIDAVARGSKTPVSKRVVIRIVPTNEPDVAMG
ncbi:MAG: FdhF/YdeP family oxidoreductase [Phaeodactylibacter sp.]|nr:FdhF/YdeP family oxidoreductase [Phaeodactylibacter sp.]